MTSIMHSPFVFVPILVDNFARSNRFDPGSKF